MPIPSLVQPRRASNAALSNPSLHSPGSSTFPSSSFSNLNAYADTDSSSGRRPFNPANHHPTVGARNTNEGTISGTHTEPPPVRIRQRQPAPFDPIAQARIDAQLGATGILQTRNLNPSNNTGNEWWGSQQEPMRGDVRHGTFREAIEQQRTWEYQRHQDQRNWMLEMLRQDQQRDNHGGPSVPDNVELGED